MDTPEKIVRAAYNMVGDWQNKTVPGCPSAETLLNDISAYGEQCRRAGAEANEKLQAFKDYVHKRLDDAGIPTHPNGAHSKEGCRIGDRLDIILAAEALSMLPRAIPSGPEAASPAAGWLLERPQTPDRYADWWHPQHGWTRDPNRGLRFARKEDAEAYRSEGRFTSDVVATEHLWVSAPSEEARAG